MKINYWDCKYNNYNETWDGEEETRHYGCDHPDADSPCLLENKYCEDEDECELLKERQP